MSSWTQASKSRRPPLSWAIGMGGAMIAAAVWSWRRLIPAAPELTKAQEKQRRKQMVHDYKRTK